MICFSEFKIHVSCVKVNTKLKIGIIVSISHHTIWKKLSFQVKSEFLTCTDTCIDQSSRVSNCN